MTNIPIPHEVSREFEDFFKDKSEVTDYLSKLFAKKETIKNSLWKEIPREASKTGVIKSRKKKEREISEDMGVNKKCLKDEGSEQSNFSNILSKHVDVSSSQTSSSDEDDEIIPSSQNPGGIANQPNDSSSEDSDATMKSAVCETTSKSPKLNFSLKRENPVSQSVDKCDESSSSDVPDLNSSQLSMKSFSQGAIKVNESPVPSDSVKRQPLHEVSHSDSDDSHRAYKRQMNLTAQKKLSELPSSGRSKFSLVKNTNSSGSSSDCSVKKQQLIGSSLGLKSASLNQSLGLNDSSSVRSIFSTQALKPATQKLAVNEKHRDSLGQFTPKFSSSFAQNNSDESDNEWKTPPGSATECVDRKSISSDNSSSLGGEESVAKETVDERSTNAPASKPGETVHDDDSSSSSGTSNQDETRTVNDTGRNTKRTETASDSDSDGDDPLLERLSGWLHPLKERNRSIWSSISPLPGRESPFHEVISKKDRIVAMIQCPKDVDIRDLLSGRALISTQYKLPGRKGEHNMYDVTVIPAKENSKCLLALPSENDDFRLREVNFKNCITVSQILESSAAPTVYQPNASLMANSAIESDSDEDTIAKTPLPSGLKVRHPVLGTSFNEASPTTFADYNTSKKYNKLRRKEERRLKRESSVASDAGCVNTESPKSVYQYSMGGGPVAVKSPKRETREVFSPSPKGEETEIALSNSVSPAKKMKKKIKPEVEMVRGVDVSGVAEVVSSCDEVTAKVSKKKKNKKNYEALELASPVNRASGRDTEIESLFSPFESNSDVKKVMKESSNQFIGSNGQKKKSKDNVASSSSSDSDSPFSKTRAMHGKSKFSDTPKSSENHLLIGDIKKETSPFKTIPIKKIKSEADAAVSTPTDDHVFTLPSLPMKCSDVADSESDSGAKGRKKKKSKAYNMDQMILQMIAERKQELTSDCASEIDESNHRAKKKKKKKAANTEEDLVNRPTTEECPLTPIPKKSKKNCTNCLPIDKYFNKLPATYRKKMKHRSDSVSDDSMMSDSSAASSTGVVINSNTKSLVSEDESSSSISSKKRKLMAATEFASDVPKKRKKKSRE